MSAMTLQEHTARAFDTDIAGMRRAVDDLRDALVETLVPRMNLLRVPIRRPLATVSSRLLRS